MRDKQGYVEAETGLTHCPSTFFGLRFMKTGSYEGSG
jgi:hypothetical protein